MREIQKVNDDLILFFSSHREAHPKRGIKRFFIILFFFNFSGSVFKNFLKNRLCGSVQLKIPKYRSSLFQLEKKFKFSIKKETRKMLKKKNFLQNLINFAS